VVEFVAPQPVPVTKPEQQPIQDPIAPIPERRVNVATRVLAALVIIIIWVLLSMTRSQLLLLAHPICSSGILPIPFCSWGSPIMDPGEMFDWPDGDIILRSTHNTKTRDFRVHRLFLSCASPVFKDLLTVPQCTSPPTTVCVFNMDDPPRAIELILRFIYPSSFPPVLDDLTTVSEALIIANTYKIEVARSRLRSSLVRLAETEPLRVYAVAYRLGFENEMKVASTHTLPINIPALAQLPDEFKFVPATEYHRLIYLHTRYRNEAMAITTRSQPGVFDALAGAFGILRFVGSSATGEAARAAMLKAIVDIIMKGTPLDFGSLALALETDYGIGVDAEGIGNIIHSVLEKINALNLTV